MRARSTGLLLVLFLFWCGWCGCGGEIPAGNTALSAAGEEVELVTDAPSPETYDSFQEIVVVASGLTRIEATRNAEHLLRNRGAEIQARFVKVEENHATMSKDFSGKTIVKLRGKAYRNREEPPPQVVRTLHETPAADGAEPGDGGAAEPGAKTGTDASVADSDQVAQKKHTDAGTKAAPKPAK